MFALGPYVIICVHSYKYNSVMVVHLLNRPTEYIRMYSAVDTRPGDTRLCNCWGFTKPQSEPPPEFIMRVGAYIESLA